MMHKAAALAKLRFSRMALSFAKRTAVLFVICIALSFSSIISISVYVMTEQQKTQDNFRHIPENFSDRLILARKQNGLKPEELAKRLGLADSSQIYRYESGKANPSISALKTLAKILKIDLHWLITGRPAPEIVEFVEILRPAIVLFLTELEQVLKNKESQLFGISLRAGVGDKGEEEKIPEIEKEIDIIKTRIGKILDLLKKLK
jgi:transcriptional regulator with XRE-family HTH domain